MSGEDATTDRRQGNLRLGGMAFRNGLLISGPTSWALAVRRPDGTIEVDSGRKPVLARGLAAKVPFLRGPLRLAEALLVLPVARWHVRSARLAFEDPLVVGAIGAGFVANRLARRIRSTTSKELALAAISMSPALLSLRDRELAAYHGAEHMAIAHHESGSADPSEERKEHRRCGSNLLVPMLLLSGLAQAATSLLFRKPGPVHRMTASLLAAGAAVELFAYADRNPDSAVAAAIHTPGMLIQKYISTAQPTEDQLEVARASLAAVLAAEGQASRSDSPH